MGELDEILEVVDLDNKVVGKATRGECYKIGLLHRAVNIFIFRNGKEDTRTDKSGRFIFNPQGEVFLHKRSKKKLKYPGFWDLSCSEHVKPGESFEEAAKRGLQEELGVEMELKVIIPIHRMDNNAGDHHDDELVVTYKGVYDGKMKYDPNEVVEGKFFNPDELPQPFTSWFLEDWKLLK